MIIHEKSSTKIQIVIKSHWELMDLNVSANSWGLSKAKQFSISSEISIVLLHLAHFAMEYSMHPSI
jgi:hypothetical protein